jgi:hypothetical protein
MERLSRFQAVSAAGIFVLALASALASCSMDGGGTNSLSTTNVPSAFVGEAYGSGFSGAFEQALESRFTHKSRGITADTRIIVTHSKNLASLASTLQAVYERGGVIVVIEPQYAHIASVSGTLGHTPALSHDGEYEIYAFNKEGAHYIHTGMKAAARAGQAATVKTTETDDVGITTEDTTIRTENVPARALSDEEYNALFNPLIAWLNKNVNPRQRDKAAPLSDTAPADVAANFDYQTITTNFTRKIAASFPHGDSYETPAANITVETTVYPLYAFSDQPAQGDYYIIRQVITNPNGEWYRGIWTTNHAWGFKNHLCAGYRKQFSIRNTITNAGSRTVSFAGATVPGTTVGETSYTTGMSWNLGGAMSGGFNGDNPTGSITVNGGVSFTDTRTRTISDVDILNRSSDPAAAWEVDFNNLARAHQDSVVAPAAAARTTHQLETEWIWRVEGMADNDADTKFTMNISVPPFENLWQALWVWGSGTVRQSSGTVDSQMVSGNDYLFDIPIDLAPPNRIPTAKLVIQNDGASHLTDIKIWANDADPATAAPFRVLTDITVPPHESAETWLPTGLYKVQLKAGTDVYRSQTDGFNLPVRGGSLLVYFDPLSAPDFTAGSLP